MPRADATEGPSRTRKRWAAVVALVGIAVVSGHLARVWPRNVEVAYRPNDDIERVDVDIVLDDEAITSARFFRATEARNDFVHTVSLPPGEYEARITVYDTHGRAVEHSRVIVVPSDGLTRFDLRGR